MDRVMAAKRGGAAGRRPGAGGARWPPARARRERQRAMVTDDLPDAGRRLGPLRRRRRRRGARRRRSSAPGWSRASRWPTTRRCSTSGPRSSASGGCAAPAAAADRPTRSWSRPRAGPGCGTGWTGSSPTRCSRRPWCTATSRATPRATTWWCSTRTAHAERARFTFPRQRAGAPAVPGRLLPARGRAGSTWSRCSWSPSASRSASTPRSCSPANDYRDYLEVHGLSVQLTEALAEYWHRRIRSELTLPDGRSLADDDPADLAGILRTDYRGCRYAFGYPACPDLEDRAKIVDAAGAGADRRASCRRSSSSTRSSPPTRSSSTTRRRTTSTPSDAVALDLCKADVVSGDESVELRQSVTHRVS